MRYALDIQDRAIAYSIGSVMEDNPTFRFFLDEDVDPGRLKAAITKAFEACPFMKTRLVFDGKYCLEENEEEFIIHNCSFENRPLRFGAGHTGYLFQISYYGNELIFDMTHIAMDGFGILQFMKTVLAAYFGLAVPPFDPEIYTCLNQENHYDRSYDKLLGKSQARGFDPDLIPHTGVVGKCRCTFLTVPIDQILAYGRQVEASPAAIVPALIARTFRKHLNHTDNVRGKICANTRKILGISTMHNCFMNAFITYTDAFDKYEFSAVCSLYRSILDISLIEENVLHDIVMKKESLQKLESNTDPAAAMADAGATALEDIKTLCNYNFSYLGELPFGEGINEHLIDFQGISVNDNSEFGVLAYSTGGQLCIQISENYDDKSILDEFIDICAQVNITVSKKDEYEYKQALFDLC